VYAKDFGTDMWQRTIHVGQENFDTLLTKLPAWLTDQEYLGEGRRQINVRQFLQDNCQPFGLEEHLRTPNVVYYLMVVRNGDDTAATSVMASV